MAKKIIPKVWKTKLRTTNQNVGNVGNPGSLGILQRGFTCNLGNTRDPDTNYQLIIVVVRYILDHYKVIVNHPHKHIDSLLSFPKIKYPWNLFEIISLYDIAYRTQGSILSWTVTQKLQVPSSSVDLYTVGTLWFFAELMMKSGCDSNTTPAKPRPVLVSNITLKN